MAWQNDMVGMLRVLINDTEAPQTYTDARLQNLIVVGAIYVDQELDFDTTYDMDVATTGIAPDPTLDATKDIPFTNLTVLKSACLTDHSTFRTKALTAGFEAKCGPAVLKTLKHLDGFKDLLTMGPCAAYDELKHQYQMNDTNLLFAIFSPFTSDDFDANYLSQGDDFFRG